MTDEEIAGFFNDTRPFLQGNLDLRDPQVEGWFGRYVDDLLAIDPRAFGRRPPDLAELLTDLALGSPVILAARSLRGGASVGDDTRRRLAALIADAFWRLFNRPAAIALLRQLASGTAARDESAYWRLVLRYCQHGNLQAVLDEQWHMLWDQESWSEDAGADETAGKCARKLVQVVHPTRARVHGQFFRAERGASGGSVEREELRVRTVFALRFGQSRTDDGDYISQGCRPSRVQRPVSALRARQHVDWAGRARFPSLVPPPDPLESSGQSGGSRTARGAYPPVQGPCRPTQCRCLPRSRRLRIVECWRRHLEVDVRAGRQGGAGRRRQRTWFPTGSHRVNTGCKGTCRNCRTRRRSRRSSG